MQVAKMNDSFAGDNALSAKMQQQLLASEYSGAHFFSLCYVFLPSFDPISTPSGT